MPACGKTDHWQLRQMRLRRGDGRAAGKENAQRGRCCINILTNGTLHQTQELVQHIEFVNLYKKRFPEGEFWEDALLKGNLGD